MFLGGVALPKPHGCSYIIDYFPLLLGRSYINVKKLWCMRERKTPRSSTMMEEYSSY
jgi:hypothetical protein